MDLRGRDVKIERSVKRVLSAGLPLDSPSPSGDVRKWLQEEEIATMADCANDDWGVYFLVLESSNTRNLQFTLRRRGMELIEWKEMKQIIVVQNLLVIVTLKGLSLMITIEPSRHSSNGLFFTSTSSTHSEKDAQKSSQEAYKFFIILLLLFIW